MTVLNLKKDDKIIMIINKHNFILILILDKKHIMLSEKENKTPLRNLLLFYWD